jgi:two-component system, sensor histidine kinase LadS
MVQVALFGAFYGALALLILYTAILFAATRLRIYGVYAVYVGALIVFLATQNGLASFFLWPEQPALSDRAAWFGVFVGCFCSCWFSRIFLDTKGIWPKADRGLAIAQWSAIPCGMLSIVYLSSAGYWIGTAYTVVSTTIAYGISGYFALVKKTRAGAFHFAAFSLTFVGLCFMVGRFLGVVSVNLYSEFGLQLGTLFETILLALGLSDRVASLRRDKESAEAAALTDPLTGLGNRAWLMLDLPARLARAARSGAEVAVIVIDLDGFKDVNDSHGHHVGDQFLQALAARLKTQLRAYDTVVRMGGDEFIVAVESVSASADVSVVAEKIRSSLAESVHISQTVGKALELQVSSSIGVAKWNGQHHANHLVTEVDIRSLLKAADDAMYQGKRGGKNQVHIASTLPPRN